MPKVKDKEKEVIEDINNVDPHELESEDTLILRNKIDTLEEKLRYQQAELINYRKRKDEEVANMLKFANQDLIIELLPLVDNFERAIKFSQSEDNKTLEGFKMIYNNLLTVLNKYGVEVIKSDGEVFNPNLHDALLIESDNTKEDNIVLETLITGYTLKGKVIRPSSVKVNKLN